MWTDHIQNMRLGTSPVSDGFAGRLNTENKKIQTIYQEHLESLTDTAKTRVMLGDSTITEQETFDPARVREYYNSIATGLESKGWTVRDITLSNNEDLRRIFTKFEAKEGNYLLSGHVSIQFHVLLYYKPDYRVVECQKELSKITEQTGDSEADIAAIGEARVTKRLKKAGYENDMDHQSLFELFYKDDGLCEEIHREIESSTDADVQKLSEKKAKLLGELDDLLVETYQTTSVLIDDTRLVTGEEGVLCTIDLEFVKDGARQGLFDLRKVPQRTQDAICQRLEGFLDILQAQRSQ